MAVIELREVSKLYGFGDATTLALNEVDLLVEPGEFVAIMGPSGSGKTTLMNLIGLLDKPTHGDYLLGNRYVSLLRQRALAKLRRDHIGFVFQSFNLLPKLTVLENVALPLAYKGNTPVRRLKKASDMLERVGMRDREYYFPKHLSGGQMQRAAIARALINNPSIIIADEPTGNLDSANSKIVMELLGDIHRQGNTILMVTHNPELTRFATRVIYMHDGMIVGDEKTKIGELAEGARDIYYQRRVASEEDLVAGVSALMKEVPPQELKGGQKTTKPAKKRGRPKKSASRKTARKKKP